MTITADAFEAHKPQPRPLLSSEVNPFASDFDHYSTVRLPAHLNAESAAGETIQKSLQEPLADFHARPSKKIRAQLVEAGLRLIIDAPKARDLEICRALGESLEAIHAGSLIIDDIQDQSAERRGSPTLHKKFGVPLALNAGNWLYFKSFELIRELVDKYQLTNQTELRLYRLCHQVMLDAHVGQAIDLGAKISEVDRKKVPDICLASLRLKTGALMALAFGAGAVLAQASDVLLERVLVMGSDLGVSLQMFDDLGNIQLSENNPKRFEDLLLNRPSWVWAAVADNSTDLQYKHFLLSVRELPAEDHLIQWLRTTQLLPLARQQALVFSNAVIGRFQNQFPSQVNSQSHSQSHRKSDGTTHETDTTSALHIVQDLLERIQISYG